MYVIVVQWVRCRGPLIPVVTLMVTIYLLAAASSKRVAESRTVATQPNHAYNHPLLPGPMSIHGAEFLILYWTNNPAEEKREYDWFPRSNNMIYQGISCDHTHRCAFTNDRDLVAKSKAVLIHASKTQHFPTMRPKGQKWVFYEGSLPPPRESQYSNKFKSHRNHFNFTSTYSLDSDVPASMLPWTECHAEDTESSTYNRTHSYDYAQNKTRLAAWVVNKCSTSSRRELYVKALSRYIAIDTMGECGAVVHRCAKGHEDCLQGLLNSTYKFIFLFEDALCRDYVTSHLAMAYTINVVPVVLGLADYKKLLPPGTFIDVRDYSSPQKLANYLELVSMNATLYNQYIVRRQRSKCVLQRSYLCRLCEYLQMNSNRSEMVTRVEEQWNSENLCHSNEQFYATLGIDI